MQLQCSVKNGQFPHGIWTPVLLWQRHFHVVVVYTFLLNFYLINSYYLDTMAVLLYSEMT